MNRQQFLKTFFRAALAVFLLVIAWMTGRKVTDEKECNTCPVRSGCAGLAACTLKQNK
ncbi:MAG: hypothetical protein GYA43_07405 [Bacteroidales bacterium]|nr:hypothetical protein [Bacteroidales bacterium]